MNVFEDLVPHLEELRRRIVVSLLIFSLTFIAACFFSRQLLDLLIKPLGEMGGVQIFFQKPFEAFLAHVKVAALAALTFSSPVLFTQIWFFLAPGLYASEKKTILAIAGASTLLFLVGIFFAYFLAIPWGLRFLLSFQTENLKPLLSIGPYFSFITGMILSFGILFDFPVFIVGCVKLGVVKVQTFAGARRLIIVVIFILAAILTPSPDPVSQILLALPLVLLFEVSLWIARRVEKKETELK